MADSSSRRSRSRSPARRAPRGSKGFRWKDTARGKDDERGREDRGRQDRGRAEPGRRQDYRDRSPDRQRGRDQERERERGRGRDAEQNRRSERAGGGLRSPRREDSGPKKDKDRKERRGAAAAAAAAGQEMIIVHINDRLGTKSAIPCLPSDTIGQLKLMVAARIGRDAGQIMLRRQGERPFKDQLSLEDYGISNGVQLDLEMDTGD